MLKNRVEYFDIIKVILLMMAMFPIIPNTVKGLPIILLLGLALFYRHEKQRSFNWKLFIINSGVYIIYILSIIYTSNLSYGGRKLETGLSLMIIPLIFALIWKSRERIKKELLLKKFITIYFGAVFIYTVIIYSFLIYKGVFTNYNDPNFFRYFTQYIPLIGQHSIYASIFLSLGLLSAIYLFKDCKKIAFKLLILLISLCLFMLLIVLASKGTILAFLFSVCVYIILNNKNLKKTIFVISSIIGLLLISVIYVPSLSNRVNSLSTSWSSPTNISDLNSTQIRKVIYSCSIKSMEGNWIFGHGIGDVKDVLLKCYNDNSKTLVDRRYNSHNQYLSILLSAGIIGLGVLFIFLGYNFNIAIKNKNHLFVSILIFFSIVMVIENILERQAGVILFTFLINFFSFVNFNKSVKINS